MGYGDSYGPAVLLEGIAPDGTTNEGMDGLGTISRRFGLDETVFEMRLQFPEVGVMLVRQIKAAGISNSKNVHCNVQQGPAFISSAKVIKIQILRKRTTTDTAAIDVSIVTSILPIVGRTDLDKIQ